MQPDMETEMETTLDGIRDIKIYQNRKGYRFSVDALLLYSFVNINMQLLQTRNRFRDHRSVAGQSIQLQKSLVGLRVFVQPGQKNIIMNGLQDSQSCACRHIKI
jgi:hypothetical protein